MPYSLHHKFQYILRLKIRARLKATIMAAHVASRRSRCGAMYKTSKVVKSSIQIIMYVCPLLLFDAIKSKLYSNEI